MLLDLNKQLENHTGEVIEGDNGNIAKSLSYMIALSDSIEDPVKFWDFSKQLREVGKIEVDKSDIEKLKRFVQASKTTCGLKAQILNLINKAQIEGFKD